MNEWIEQIKNCGFTPEIFYLVTGEATVALHGVDLAPCGFKLFDDIDLDRCLAEALRFALNFDAYITNSALCGVRH